MLKPVFAGLAISSLCLALAVDLQAQSGTKSASKKKAAVQPVQAEEDDPDPPRSGQRGRRSVTDDADNADDASAPRMKGSQGGRPARPAALDPVRLETLSAELEKILKDWELNTSQFKTMAGEFSRFRYDKTFEVEKRADGKFAFEAPDKGNYELWGATIADGEVSKKRGKDGTPYQLKPDNPDRWVCNGKKVIKIDDKAKTYEEVEIPPENQGKNIIDGPLPFLFGMKAEKAKLRYKLRLNKEGNKSGGKEIWLDVIPRWQEDAANWSKATVIIEAKTYKPRAVKLLDPSGSESVHVFRNVVVNERRGLLNNPFKPNLWGYKAVLPPDKSKSAAKNKNSSTAVDDVPDLGRTADSSADNAARKKATTKQR